jgi:hypothetical protein
MLSFRQSIGCLSLGAKKTAKKIHWDSQENSVTATVVKKFICETESVEFPGENRILTVRTQVNIRQQFDS